MANLPPTIKGAYRKAVPLPIRRFLRQFPQVKKLERLIVEHLLGHDAIYDSNYYANLVEGSAVRGAGVISESILRDLKPKTVVDVGCGTGALLEALRKRGCLVFGLEYSEAALGYCRERRLEVLKFNLERDILNTDRTFDVAISMEVAEHLPERTADRYVDLLTRLSSRIVFTAAHPGQGGRHHLNEQPQPYWFSKFRARSFDHDEELSKSWREWWMAKGVVAAWYYQNLMIFHRGIGTVT
jgi:SAM-dependent methyltransferase